MAQESSWASPAADRPAYDLTDTMSIEAGLGMFIEISLDWLVIINTSVELLEGQVSDSPIVEKDYVLKGFAAINYLFKKTRFNLESAVGWGRVCVFGGAGRGSLLRILRLRHWYLPVRHTMTRIKSPGAI